MESLKRKETSQRPFDPRQNIAFCHRPRRKRVQDEAPGAEIQFGTTRADSARSELSRPDNIMMAGMTHSTPSEQALMAAWRRSPCGRHDPQKTPKYGAYIPDRAGEVASPQPEHREITHSCTDHINAIIDCYDRKPSSLGAWPRPDVSRGPIRTRVEDSGSFDPASRQLGKRLPLMSKWVASGESGPNPLVLGSAAQGSDWGVICSRDFSPLA
jgi:hypothetical protein